MPFLRALTLLLVLCASSRADEIRIIKEAQDSRAADSAELKAAASSASAGVRKQAYLAMGRVQSEAYLKPLLAGLSGGDETVLEQAVFSLGQLGLAEPELSSTTLLYASLALDKFIPGVKGELKRASVEALGKVGGPEATTRFISALSDDDPRVRGEAALSLFRQRFLKRVPEYSTETVNALVARFDDRDPEVRWRAVYAFSRFAEPRAAKALSKMTADKNIWVRFFACRALGLLAGKAPWKSLVEDLSDKEYLVRTEAVKALGLAGQGREDRFDGLFTDSSSHVRAAAVDAIAATGAPAFSPRAVPWSEIEGWLNDGSVMVQGQALLAQPTLEPERALRDLDADRNLPHWWPRTKAYEALGQTPGAQSLLKEGIKDKDPRVAAAALEALAKSTSTEIDGILEKILSDPNVELELAGTAAEAAKDRKPVSLLPVERAAYEGKLAERYPELADDLFEAYNETRKAHPEAKAPELKEKLKKKIVLSEFLGAKPKPATVVLETERGTVEIELAVKDAPIHSATFIDSVKKKLYDGTVWHRIVPGFVAQGGDPRGSGWGDGGISLRDEINQLKFDRGGVGMPKAGKDTGGCQLFITYVPTPHLDGRYTVFGHVVKGMDIVDRLEPGDVIRRAFLK